MSESRRPGLRPGFLEIAATAVVVLAYVASWRHGFSVEHLGFVEDRVQDASSYTLVTGGGALFVWLMEAARLVGTLEALLGVHALLDLLVVLVWAGASRHLVPAPVLSTLALAMFWIPKAHVAENSALVSFPAALLFLAALRAHRSPTPAAVGAVAGTALVTLHLSLTGVLLLPLVLLALVVAPERRVRRGWALAVGAGVVLALIAFVASGLAAGVLDVALAIIDDIFRQPRMIPRPHWMPLRLLLNPLVLLGGWIAIREAEPTLRFALVWYLSVLVPTAALTAYGEADVYHSAALAPAWAVLTAAAARRLLQRVADLVGRPPSAVLPLAAAAAVLGWGVRVSLPAAEPLARFACWTVIDQAPPCGSQALSARLEQLRALDLLDTAKEAVFYGSHGACLTGAWTWLGAQPVDAPARVLLLERAHADDELAARLGGLLTEDLIVIPGVIPAWIGREPPAYSPALIAALPPEQILRWAYVAMESDQYFGPHLGEPDLGAPYLGGACWGLPSGPSSSEIAAGWTIADARTPPDPDYWTTKPGWLAHADELRFEYVIMIPGPPP